MGFETVKRVFRGMVSCNMIQLAKTSWLGQVGSGFISKNSSNMLPLGLFPGGQLEFIIIDFNQFLYK